MPTSQRLRLIDLWIALHPISDEFRRSLGVKAIALAKAHRASLQDEIEVLASDELPLDEKLSKFVDHR